MSHPNVVPPANAGMVGPLVIAIAVMTLAIAFILGAFFGRVTAPAGGAEPPHGTIDFSAAPEVEIGLPPGVRVTAAHVEAGRITLETQSVHGEVGVYTAPVTGLEGPVRIVYRSLE